MLRVDFHCHTRYSKDSLTTPEKLLEACKRKGLDRVVITDHNTIAGALHAQKLDPQRVIVGEEIMTLADTFLSAGAHEVTLDGPRLPSGLYFYALQQGVHRQVKKLLVLR